MEKYTKTKQLRRFVHHPNTLKETTSPFHPFVSRLLDLIKLLASRNLCLIKYMKANESELFIVLRIFMPSNVIRHLKHQTLAYVILQRDFLLYISYWIPCSEMFTQLECVYRRLYGFTRWFKFSRKPSENRALSFALFMVFVHRLRFRKSFRFYSMTL